jgi:Transposase IS116/IS110/IS902 family
LAGQPVSTGVLPTRLASSICLTRKSATSHRRDDGSGQTARWDLQRTGRNQPSRISCAMRCLDRRRALARYAGLTGSPDESGRKRREKGLARSGNARVRRGMIQLAWRFLLRQKDSALTKWFRSRTENARGDVSIWELTGPSSGPFPHACSLCAMELDRARPVGRFCDMSAFERCQQLGDAGGDATRLVGVISIQERTARTEPSFGLRPLIITRAGSLYGLSFRSSTILHSA